MGFGAASGKTGSRGSSPRSTVDGVGVGAGVVASGVAVSGVVTSGVGPSGEGSESVVGMGLAAGVWGVPVAGVLLVPGGACGAGRCEPGGAVGSCVTGRACSGTG